MPTLNWIGKDKVVNHHHDVPFRILDHKYGYTAEKGEQSVEVKSGNKIIHGDNLEALKALLPEYEGRIDCIYIDPPYNTGNEAWVYNDNVNHPKIRKWLGEVVGKAGEDFTRHDKWLCMMYPRLKLIHKLLAEAGALFISIDDNEVISLKLICDEVFGTNCFVAVLPTIMNLKGNQDQFAFAGTHEYTIVYAKNKNLLKINNLSIDEEDAESWDEDKIGYYKKGAPLRATGSDAKREDRPLMFYPILMKDGLIKTILDIEFENIYNKTTGNFNDEYLSNLKIHYENDGWSFILPIENKTEYGRWRWGYNDNTKARLSFDVIYTKTKNGITLYKKQRPELGDLPSKKPKSIFYKPEYSSGNGTNQLKQIFGTKVFQNPKPLELLSDLLHISTTKESIILDSFAGSGTTAHAILNLNKLDIGNRKFILIEMEDYAESITSERVKRVINGYENIEGTGGTFDFYELGAPIFKEDQNLNEEVGEQKIREYIYYTETKQHLEREQLPEYKYLLDTYNNTSYYFYYEKDKFTTLSLETLNIVTEKAEQYLIYADHCLLDKDYMMTRNIIFKKIPRDIKRF